jgi:hypothetical protein
MPRKPDVAATTQELPLPAWAMWLASGAILFHLTAVVVAPLAVPARYNERPSALARTGWELFQPYLDAAYLNHGYKFFAPDPGRAIHLLAYQIDFEDGRSETGYLPDAKKYWPRLRYHRHFMLADQMLGGDTKKVQAWEESFARHLKARHGAKSVALYHCWHRTPTPDEVREGMPLSDPRLFVSDVSERSDEEAERKFGPEAWTLIGVFDGE